MSLPFKYRWIILWTAVLLLLFPTLLASAEPPTFQTPSTIDKIIEALSQLSQAQTDTLALIVVIAFLVVIGIAIVIFYLIYRTRAKVVIPSTDNRPAQLVTEKEFMGIMLNTFLGRLEVLNTQNDNLNERLKDSIAVSEKVTPALEGLLNRVNLTATTVSVNELSGRVDSGFSEAALARQELSAHMEEIHKNTSQLVDSDKELVEKVEAVLNEINKLGKQGEAIRLQLTDLITKVELETASLEKALNIISEQAKAKPSEPSTVNISNVQGAQLPEKIEPKPEEKE